MSEPVPHGTRTRYVRGCRCFPCRLAERQYKRAYRERQYAAGDRYVRGRRVAGG